MKSIIILIVAVLLVSTVGAQDRQFDPEFSLRAGIGYNFPWAVGYQAFTTSNGAVSGIYGSWAQGWLANMDFGIRAYKNLWGVLSLNYTNGKSVDMFVAYPSIGTTRSTPANKFQIPLTITFGGRYFINLSGSSGSGDLHDLKNRFQPYLGIGAGVALAANMKSGTSHLVFKVNPILSDSMDVKSTTTFKPGAVFYGEAGVKFAISKSLSLFLEARFTSLSLMNYKRKVTSAIMNGQDVTSGLSDYQKETDYVKNMPAQYSGGPDKELADKFPASGISINCGLAWNFGGGKVQLSPGPQLNPGGVNPGPSSNPGGKNPGGTNPTPSPNPGGSNPEGGTGGSTREVPKGGGATTERIKSAAVYEKCRKCPETELTLTSNNDKDEFPENYKKNVTDGPWGQTKLDSIQITGWEAGCDQCDPENLVCCCHLKKLKVTLYFHLSFNNDAIDKGVWLNVNKDSKQFGNTCLEKDLPRDEKASKDWKKVDKKNVETHERQHCADLKEVARPVIEKELATFPVYQCVCSNDGNADCKEDMYRRSHTLKVKAEDAVRKAISKTSEKENEHYREGSLEKKAREVQAEELRNRH